MRQFSVAKCFLLSTLLLGVCVVSRCITHAVQQSMHEGICLVLLGVLLAYRYFSRVLVCGERDTDALGSLKEPSAVAPQ